MLRQHIDTSKFNWGVVSPPLYKALGRLTENVHPKELLVFEEAAQNSMSRTACAEIAETTVHARRLGSNAINIDKTVHGTSLIKVLARCLSSSRYGTMHLTVLKKEC